MLREITIEAPIENIVYYNEENGYAVFSVFSEEHEDIFDSPEIICVGNVSKISVGDNMLISGNIKFHNTYGKQLKITYYEKSLPKTEHSIEKYLASGAISGVGKSLAKRIVKNFGLETLNIIEKTPEKLIEIKGISKQKAFHIHKVFLEEIDFKNCAIFLQNYDISITQATKIYKHFKNNTINVVKNNPYELSEKISGISFKIADDIAKKVGIDLTSTYRIKSAIKYILSTSASSNGHTFLPEEDLVLQAINILSLSEDLIKETILELRLENQVYIEKFENKNIIFLSYYYNAEKYIAKKVLELSVINKTKNLNYEKKIKEIENIENIEFEKQQKIAIEQAMLNGVLVINGGPGTGKTTTINAIISLFKAQSLEVELAAPTGRAAKRMTETTGTEAQTIHKLLGINYISESAKNQIFDKNEDNPIEADVIIIDECSMIDVMLMYNLLRAVPYGAKLILVGDTNQLPSVGAGNVLKDIINSKIVKVVSLNKIFRQAKESAIIINAHKINQGIYPDLKEKNNDFFFIKNYNQEKICDLICDLVINRLPKFLNCKPNEVQVLSPMKKSSLGIKNLNKVLQNIINPASSSKDEKVNRENIFRVGDKVMQIKNNYSMPWSIYENDKCINSGLGIFNGDEGIITSIDMYKETINVVFDENKTVSYKFNQLDELELSYAITIHKSQGSEYPAVIIPIHSGSPMLFNRNLIYTAVTRAKKLVVIVGIPETLFKMIDNNNQIERYTYLSKILTKLSDFIV